jgi:hypothetical protein
LRHWAYGLYSTRWWVMQRSVKTLYSPGQGSPPSRRRLPWNLFNMSNSCHSEKWMVSNTWRDFHHVW